MRCQEPHFGVARRKLFASVVNGGHYEYTKGAAMLESSFVGRKLWHAKALLCFACYTCLAYTASLPFPPHTHSVHLAGTHTSCAARTRTLARHVMPAQLLLLHAQRLKLFCSLSLSHLLSLCWRLTLALLLLLQRIANALWTSPISVDPPLLLLLLLPLLAFVLCRPPLAAPPYTICHFLFCCCWFCFVVPCDCLACCSAAIGLCCAASTYGSILYVTDSLHFSWNDPPAPLYPHTHTHT